MDDFGRAVVHGLDDRLAQAREQAGKNPGADAIAWVALGLLRDYVATPTGDGSDVVWAQMCTLSAGIDDWMTNGPAAMPLFESREERDAYIDAKLAEARKER